MTGVIVHPIDEQLILHEGLRLKAYLDTENYWTTGIGYNLSSRGTDDLVRICGRVFPSDLSLVTLTKDEALAVLHADIARVQKAIGVHFPFNAQLDPVRQKVVLDMGFNLGFKALSFKDTRAAVERRDWSMAARHCFKSKWAHQVDDGPGGHFGRADRLMGMLLTGNDYTK